MQNAYCLWLKNRQTVTCKNLIPTLSTPSQTNDKVIAHLSVQYTSMFLRAYYQWICLMQEWYTISLIWGIVWNTNSKNTSKFKLYFNIHFNNLDKHPLHVFKQTNGRAMHFHVISRSIILWQVKRLNSRTKEFMAYLESVMLENQITLNAYSLCTRSRRHVNSKGVWTD